MTWIKISSAKLFLLLISRTVLFVFFQGLIALFLNSWSGSVRYWMTTATLTNVVSIALMTILLEREGIKFLSLFRIDRTHWKMDVLLFIGLALISIPLVIFPSWFLTNWLWSDPDHARTILFQPMSLILVYALLIAFPLTIGLAELATYFGYVMPRLRRNGVGSAAVVLPIVFLSIQHCTLPLAFDLKFIAYRGLMYLPFATLLGFALNARPSLLPYLSVLHALLDASAVGMMLTMDHVI